MGPSRLDSAGPIVGEALERAPEERAAFLEEACAGQPGLRAEVEALLAAHSRAGVFLAGVTSGSADGGRTGTGADPIEPGRIGPYKLLQVIGEGGFGSVYMAEQR